MYSMNISLHPLSISDSISFPLLRLLTLHILIRPKRNRPTDQNHRIEHHAHARLAAAPARSSGDLVRGGGLRGWVVRSALQWTNEQAVEDLARFVAVADVFEGFGCVLAADV
jgi:hypothetical protein